MSRGHQPEDQLGRPVSFEGRQQDAVDPPRTDELRQQASPGAPPWPGRKPDRPGMRTPEVRAVYELRGRTYRLRTSEIATMAELGKFRAVAREDLAEFAYGGDEDRLRPDVENLFRQGLVEMKSIPHEVRGSRHLLTLTKQGHRLLLQTQRAGKDQALYRGFTKAREAHHDANLYRLYQKAAGVIEGQGGRNLRVALDHELKKHLYRDLAKLGIDRNSAAGKQVVAEKHGLQVVWGKIPLPDVRIEYETRDGERARADFELVTGHYRGRNLSEKVRAGFALYAHADDVASLRRVLGRCELTAEILSL